MSQGPLDLGFKSGRSKCSICYDMLDFYKKKKQNKNKKNTECQLTVTKNMLITPIDIMSDLDTVI